MQTIVWILIILLNPLALNANKEDEVQKELKALQGTWRTVGGEAGGSSFPENALPSFTVVIGPDGKSTGQTPQEEFQFTLTVNPRKTPKTMENLHESGEQKGKMQYGVYKLEGDRFTVCVTPRGSPESNRPKDFNTKDTANVVFVFERVKDKPKP